MPQRRAFVGPHLDRGAGGLRPGPLCCPPQFPVGGNRDSYLQVFGRVAWTPEVQLGLNWRIPLVYSTHYIATEQDRQDTTD